MPATDTAFVGTIESYFGTPYSTSPRFSPHVGLDCSGAVTTALKANGVNPPVDVSDGYESWARGAGTTIGVARASLTPGSCLIRNGLGAAGDIATVIAPGMMAVTPCPAGHFLGPAPTTWGHYDDGILIPGLAYTGVVAGAAASTSSSGGGGCDPTDPTTWLACVAEIPADLLKALLGGHTVQELGIRTLEVIGGALVLAVGAVLLLKALNTGESGRAIRGVRSAGRRPVRRAQAAGRRRAGARARQDRADADEERHLERVTAGQSRRRSEEGPGRARYFEADELAEEPF